MKNIIKAAAIIYAAAVLVLTFALPIGGILCVVKACGGALSWLGACIPFIIGLSVLPFGAVAKYVVDTSTKEVNRGHRNDNAQR